MKSRKWELLLADLSPEDRARIESRLRARRFAPRTLLFEQGEHPDRIFVVRSGRVRLFLLSESGEEFVTGVTTAGSVLGLAPCILRTPRFQSAETLDEVEAGVLREPDLSAFVRTIPGFALNVARLLALLSIESTVRSGPLAFESMRMRLGSILVSLGAYDPDDPMGRRRLIRGLTQDDLAKMLGSSRTWVSLTLAEFAKGGLIHKSRGCVTINDIGRFRGYLERARRGE